MHHGRPFGWHLNDVAVSIIAMVIRLVVLFAVIGIAYAVYASLGAGWFYVFVFAAIAVRLHLELSWIERHFAEAEDADSRSKDEPKPNPFRKR